MSNSNHDYSNSRSALATAARSQQDDGSTTIRRTLVEHGLRPVGNDALVSSHESTMTSLSLINQQHQDEQRELQELNAKFAVYLDRVHYLENNNHRLTDELNSLKKAWGNDAAKVHAHYGPQLKALREEIDKAIRDQGLRELQLKRHEYDLWQIQQQIATFDDNYDINKLNSLKQELDATTLDIDHLAKQLELALTDLSKQRSTMENLLKELENLKNELDNQQLERIILENELQTLKEHASFQTAIYQAERAELSSLATPVIDVSRFYRTELANAISDIRKDFEVLSQSQVNELEEYYRVKTEQVRQEIESENERKRLLASEGAIESMDTTHLTSSLRDNNNDLAVLREQNSQLQSHFDAIVDDLERIQDEHLRERQSYDHEIVEIRQQIADKQEAIDSLLQNNISLRFEMSTYRHLLDSEEQRLNKMENQQSLQTSQLTSTSVPLTSASLSSTPSFSSSQQHQQNYDQTLNDLGTKKMTVQKTARGPISFESVDLETDAVILVNEKYSGNQQSLRDWTIHRQVDQQPELIYQFPATFSLRPRQTIRIFSKRSSYSARSIGDMLIADRIDTWGIGRKMVTRLIDEHNEEKAIITQIFQ